MWRGLVLGSLVVGGLAAAMAPAVAQDDAASEGQYVAKTSVLIGMMADGLGEFTDKANLYKADITDEQLMLEVAAETGVWEAIYDAAQELDAPDGFEIAHYEMLKTFQPLSEAAGLIREGMADQDAAKLGEAAGLIGEATTQAAVARDALVAAAARD